MTPRSLPSVTRTSSPPRSIPRSPTTYGSTAISSTWYAPPNDGVSRTSALSSTPVRLLTALRLIARFGTGRSLSLGALRSSSPRLGALGLGCPLGRVLFMSRWRDRRLRLGWGDRLGIGYRLRLCCRGLRLALLPRRALATPNGVLG